MARRQLFEFEDQSWLPSALRDYMTDALRVVLGGLGRHTGMARRLAARLGELLDREHSGGDRILDLCSGGSGALLPIVAELERTGRSPRVLLTDKYPNVPAFEALHRETAGRVDYLARPVDAGAVPDDLAGVRTLLAAFHHFDDAAAREILRDAAVKGRCIAVFEASERHPVMLLAMPLVPLAVLLLTPLFRPFRPGRLVFTYLVPVVPALVFWDGIVSCLRSRSPAELRTLAAGICMPGYRFEVGQDRVPRLPLRVTWLLGYPEPADPEADADPDPDATPRDGRRSDASRSGAA